MITICCLSDGERLTNKCVLILKVYACMCCFHVLVYYYTCILVDFPVFVHVLTIVKASLAVEERRGGEERDSFASIVRHIAFPCSLMSFIGVLLYSTYIYSCGTI